MKRIELCCYSEALIAKAMATNSDMYYSKHYLMNAKTMLSKHLEWETIMKNEFINLEEYYLNQQTQLTLLQ